MVALSNVPTRLSFIVLLLLSCGPNIQQQSQEGTLPATTGNVAPAPGGIEFPSKYKNWPVLSITQRADRETLRVVTGNLIAVRAARSGQTNPWPDGTALASALWKQAPSEGTGQSLSTSEFIRVEFMFKDVKTYAGNDSGWGWARWNGIGLVPYGDDDVGQECRDCHVKASGNDWVFMAPAILP